MARRMALSAAVAAALAVLAWAEPAPALHELECPEFRGTRIDPTTGERLCGALSTESRKQAVRTRQLLREQRNRTQTSPEIQRQRIRPRLLLQEQQRRIRDLEVQQKILAETQARITELETGRQQQTNLRAVVKQKQPALDLQQSIAKQEIQNRQAAAEKQRRERSRLGGLRRQRFILEQEVRRMETDLLEDQKLQTRILRKEQRQ